MKSTIKNFEVLSTFTNRGANQFSPFTIIISHADADGIVSAGLMSRTLEAIGQSHVVFASMDPTQRMTDDLISEAINNYVPETCEELNLIISDRDICSPHYIAVYGINNVIWCDHHKSSIEKFKSLINQYSESNVISYVTEVSTESGATMVLKAAKDIVEQDILNYDIEKPMALTPHIVEMEQWEKVTALWDTFTWKKGPSDFITQSDIDKAVNLSKASFVLPAPMLFDLVSNGGFEEYYDKIQFTASIYQYKLDKAIEEALDRSTKYTLFNESNKMGVLVSRDVPSQFISLFADHVFETQSDVDYVILVSNGLVSTRVRQSFDFDASAVMVSLGALCYSSGGGHAKAAGCKYKDVKPVYNETPDEDIKFVVNNIFNIIKCSSGYHKEGEL